MGGEWWRRTAACAAIAIASGCGGVARTAAPVVEREDWSHVIFSWPTQGEITSTFGRRGDDHHDGIDISAPEGALIRSAAPGTVVFSGILRGYGNVIIIEHPYGLNTVYAHNQKNLVGTGTRVPRGSVIALLGRTGRASGPNLHFEVRRGKVARDPMRYLPLSEPSLIAIRSASELGG
jgi:murein DD-endopeptidase MepM/ murein hydrolase activator NlpD